MGQEIVYCYKCQTRLLASEFDKGEAFLLKERPCCRLCVIQLLPILTPEEQQTLTTSPGARTPAPAKMRRVLTPPPAPPPTERKLLIPIAGGVGGLVLLVVTIVLIAPSKPPVEPIKVAIQTPPPPDPTPVKGPLDDAREYRRLNPDDLVGQIHAYKKLLWDLEGTPHFALAKSELEPLLAQRRRILEEKLRAMDEELREKTYDKDFKSVLESYRAARTRFEDAEWAAMIDAKMADIHSGLSDYYQAIKASAKKSGDVESIRRDIARWGIESYRLDFESAFPASREHVLPASQLQGAGTFKRVGRNWVSESDTDARVRRENYVEAEFEAAANVRYRCFVFVGGCCQETMTLYVQGSDWSAGNASERRSVEPGSMFCLFKGNPKSTGPKTHAEHGGDKRATTWEWRFVELPPYSASGKKKIRFLTNSKGFAVAGVVVTSEKYFNGPPLDLFNH